MLNNRAIEAAKPRPAVYRMTDANGLYLEVRPTGSKFWRYRYEIDGRENTFSIGEYGSRADQVGLAAARLARAEAAALVANKEHPRAVKKAKLVARAENANTFAAVAESWLTTKLPRGNRPGVTPHYYGHLRSALDVDLLPALGEKMIDTITSSDIRRVLETRAHVPTWCKLVRRTASEVFRYGIVTERATLDPTLTLKGVIGPNGIIKSNPPKPNAHLAAHEIPAFLEAVDAAPACERERQIAMKLLLLTMVRPGELANAPWCEFDLDGAMWSIPNARMKMRRPHLVPLSKQAVALLRELHKMNGHTPHLFPHRGPASRPSSRVTRYPQFFTRFIASLGYAGRVTAHGLRGTASTLLNEVRVEIAKNVKVKRFENDWIECQLAHVPQGVRARYNHSSYVPERVDMMQFYADTVLPAKRGKLRLAA